VESDLPDGSKIPIFRINVNTQNKKYSAFRVGQITGTYLPVFAHQKGVRDRHERRAGDAMDAAVSRTNGTAAYGQVVWSWRRDRGVKSVEIISAGDGGKQRRSPGRARSTP
jgi:hypothetical protein